MRFAVLFRSFSFCITLLIAVGGATLGAEAPEPRVLRPPELHARLGCFGDGNANLGTPTGTAALPHLNYYGGRVISNVKIVMVLYGSGTYGSFLTNDVAPSMASFYQQVVASSYLDWLCEYSTPTQTVGRGSYAGKYLITPSSANNGSVIDDSSIQNELALQIAVGQLPAPDTNTLYMLHFPQGKTITSGGYASCVAGGFCAYHGTSLSGGSEVFYGVMPDMTASACKRGCGGAATVFDNQCSVVSHELIEAITDPEVGLATTYGPPLAWYDPVNGEIGDICNAQQATFTGTDGKIYTVQEGFSNSAGTCIASRPTVAPVANSQALTNYQGTPLSVTLAGVDPNLCPHPLTFSITANPLHGTLSGTLPTLTYTPAPDFVGQDNFSFKVNNGLADSSPATVSLFQVATNLTIALLPDRNVRLRFATIPGWSYQVQTADSLAAPVAWASLLTTNAGTNAFLVVDDLTATNHPQRFYRTTTP